MNNKIPETITEEELIKILNSTKKKHYKLAFALGFYNCLRVSEVVKLMPENVDKDRKILMIKQAKGSKDRNIPIAPEVFHGIRHLPIKIGIRALEMAIKKLAKETLNKDIHFHTLRHSGATHYLTKKRWNLREIQNFLGHARLQSTEIYTHVKPEDLINKMWAQE